MGDSTTTGSWASTVRAFCDEWRSYAADAGDGQIPVGATDAEIETLIEQAELRGLHVDNEVVEFLRMVNGAAFDGFTFFGAAIREDDSHGRSDFIRSNDTYNDQPSRYTHYASLLLTFTASTTYLTNINCWTTVEA